MVRSDVVDFNSRLPQSQFCLLLRAERLLHTCDDWKEIKKVPYIRCGRTGISPNEALGTRTLRGDGVNSFTRCATQWLSKCFEVKRCFFFQTARPYSTDSVNKSCITLHCAAPCLATLRWRDVHRATSRGISRRHSASWVFHNWQVKKMTKFVVDVELTLIST